MTFTETADQGMAQAMAAKAAAARALYAAELAVHDAHQTRVDAWIKAAHDRLHTAVVSYSSADALVASFTSPVAA